MAIGKKYEGNFSGQVDYVIFLMLDQDKVILDIVSMISIMSI
jgi:hypothetical protein